MTYIPDKLRQTRIRDKVSRAVCEIYEAFCESADKETGFTYKAIDRIADECEIRRNCGRVYLRELFEKGWLVETFGDDGRGNLIKGVTVKTAKTGWKSYSERLNNVDKNFVTPPEIDKNFVEPDKIFVNVDKNFVTPFKGINQRLNQPSNQTSGGRAVADYGTPFDALSANAVNGDANALLESWLDAVATANGAATRFTLADFGQWQQTCAKAIDDNRTLPALLAVIAAERKRLANEIHFFSPKNVLKILQAQPPNETAATGSPPDAIKNCRLCDERGLIPFQDGVKKCSHEVYERKPNISNQAAAVQPGR